jgi:hypothetical protein
MDLKGWQSLLYAQDAAGADKVARDLSFRQEACGLIRCMYALDFASLDLILPAKYIHA